MCVSMYPKMERTAEPIPVKPNLLPIHAYFLHRFLEMHLDLIRSFMDRLGIEHSQVEIDKLVGFFLSVQSMQPTNNPKTPVGNAQSNLPPVTAYFLHMFVKYHDEALLKFAAQLGFSRPIDELETIRGFLAPTVHEL